MTLDNDDLETLTEVMVALLKRFGQALTVTERELDDALDQSVVFEKLDDGGVRVHLIPDYVAVGVSETREEKPIYDAEKIALSDRQIADLLAKGSKTTTWPVGSWPVDGEVEIASGTVSSGSTSTTPSIPIADGDKIALVWNTDGIFTIDNITILSGDKP